MSEHILMKCGHASNAVRVKDDGSRVPSCVICLCEEPATEVPSLEGRKARCDSCHKTVKDSSYGLAFFEYLGPGSHRATFNCSICGFAKHVHSDNDCLPKDHWSLMGPGGLVREETHLFKARGPQEYDSFYCGCQGWD